MRHGPVTGENDFEAATQAVIKALFTAKILPDGTYRDCAVDNLKAAIGWIKQARDEWAGEDRPLSDADEQQLTYMINAGISMRKVVEFWQAAKRRAEQ